MDVLTTVFSLDQGLTGPLHSIARHMIGKHSVGCSHKSKRNLCDILKCEKVNNNH